MAITLNSFRETVEKVVGKRPKDVFHSILQEGLEQELVPARTKRAREYYRGFGAMALESSKETILKNRDRVAKLPTIGKMYFFPQRFFQQHWRLLNTILPRTLPRHLFDNSSYKTRHSENNASSTIP